MKRGMIPFTAAIAALVWLCGTGGFAYGQEAPVDEALARITTWEYGQDREILSVVADLVVASQDDPATREALADRLAALLATDATFECKQFVCRQLTRIGTERHVGALAPLLTDEQMTNMARYALERIPGAQADAALLDALGQTKGLTRTGVINSLGQRGCAGAVDPLADLARKSDPATQQAAISALADIGGKSAVKAILEARRDASEETSAGAADALLRCADGYAADGMARGAASIYKRMLSEDEPEALRGAALEGLAKAKPKRGLDRALAFLRKEDAYLQAVAADVIQDLPADLEIAKRAHKWMGKMDASGQALLLYALAERGEVCGVEAAMAALMSDSENVRIAAYTALGALGDGMVVPILADAVTGEGPTAQAARQSLESIQGARVDAALLSAATRPGGATQKMLIEILLTRRTGGTLSTFIWLAENGETEGQRAALKALSDTASEGELDKVRPVIEAAMANEGLREDAAAALEQLRTRSYRLSASHNAGNTFDAMDGRMDTRWYTGFPMTGGEWFMIDLALDETPVCGLVLDSSHAANDYPRGYEVYLSDDGETWGEPVATGEGTEGITAIEFPAQPCRFIKILQTGDSQGAYWWSINELTIETE